MDLAVVTANFGHHDQLRAQVQQDLAAADWICFTDDPDLDAPPPWRIAVRDGRGAHPNMAAKRYKLLPPVAHRFVVWVDANIEVTSSAFVREALNYVHDGVALYAHPRRDCIYDEAEASLGAESQGGKYESVPIRAQVAQYRKDGFPAHAGLYACGTIVWDRNDLGARRLGFEWLSECARWTYQDQLSFPVVARRLGIEPGVFPHPQITTHRPVPANPWLRIHPHLN